jgi:hypothetical protein
VIIVIASVVAAALVAYFLYASTARGTRATLVSVVGQPTVYANGSLYVTLKNDGTAPLSLTGSHIVVGDVNKNPVTFTFTNCLGGATSLDPGRSLSCKYNAGTGFNLGNIPDGALATLQTADGTQVSFAVAKP